MKMIRYALVAALVALLMTSSAEAGSTMRFYFGAGGTYSPFATRQYYPPTYGSHYYSHRYSSIHPYYGGRYVTPRIYSPNRWDSARFDYARSGYGRDFAYRRDHDFRRGIYGIDRGQYYGPAVERYHRHAREFPSYHYDRREGYIRGSQPSRP
jgi:hypothetical protein